MCLFLISALEHPERYRYCMVENGFQIAVDLFRNCAQQVKYCQTLEEITEFVCKTKTKEEHEKYLKCYDSAMRAEARADPKFLDVAHKCVVKAKESI
ncbi:uncharacterized protein [Centruroides vittatus]|uniref:uncharacterized protein n=1 Tax=Centruroides vittatus TaxID=120091 RepID=UPI003510C927